MVELTDKKEQEAMVQLKTGTGIVPGHHGENWRLKTSPQLLMENAVMWADRPALRKKRYGIWNSHSWKEYFENVKYFSLGLGSLGFKRNDKLIIIGDNDPEWWYSQLGAQSAGGVCVGVFIDCISSEVAYFSNNSEATFAVAKDQEQCDKFLEIRDQIPNIKKVIYWEPKGMWKNTDPWIMDFWKIVEMGKAYEKEHPGTYEEMVKLGSVDDVSCLAYTSGTTGLPKAAQLSYRSLIAWNYTLWKYYPTKLGDDYFSFLCPAWAVDQILGFLGCLEQGLIVHFPERPDTVVEDAHEISSVIELAGARMWEERYRALFTKLNDADWLKRTTYKFAMAIGINYVKRKQANQLNLMWEALYKFADLIAFRQLRDRMGYVRSVVCLVAGAMMSPELFNFFQIIGIPLYTYYGITEAGFVTMQYYGDIKRGSCGKVLPGRQVKITQPDNEVLINADDTMVFSGYYNNPEATKKAMPDGWYHTGDAAYIDDDGHFFFMDRISEMMALSDGFKFSATYIESELRCSQYIADVMVVGQDKDFVAALIQIDLKNVGQWAETNHIAYNTFVDLARKEQVYDLITSELKIINSRIPERSRLKAFANLHKEFDADEAEMTRTRKLRRAPLFEKYGDIINGIYTGADVVSVQTPVKYRDGRTGSVKAEVRVRKI